MRGPPIGSPLSSEKGFSFLSNKKAQRSTSGIGKLGYCDSKGMLEFQLDKASQSEMIGGD